MKAQITRRKLIKGLGMLPLLLGCQNLRNKEKNENAQKRIQYSVNAYSFNERLTNHEMTLIDMMDFAADIGLDAVDLTGYYFSTYPKVPTNKELYQLKRAALQRGLDISWTGVRNDFVNPNTQARSTDLQHIKEWLEASSKIGAPIMRIFAGKSNYEGHSKEEVKEWIVKELKLCATYGAEYGVLPALQHHNDFLFSSDEVIDILNRVNSDWLGLILDIGSLRQGDPYKEIEKLAPYADYWFIKEHVYIDKKAVPVDMKKISDILIDNKYQGYISFESLSEGDPKEIVSTMFQSFKNTYQNR